MTEGRKYDGEKPRMYLLPPKATLEVAKVLTFGAEKYDPENWRKLEDLQNRYSSAALRHIFAHLDDSELDEDSGLSHLAHAICCLLFKLEIELEEKGKKERARESIKWESSQSYKPAPAHFHGPETYNEEAGVRNAEYSIQHYTPRYDNSGFFKSTRVRTEKKSTESRKGGTSK